MAEDEDSPFTNATKLRALSRQLKSLKDVESKKKALADFLQDDSDDNDGTSPGNQSANGSDDTVRPPSSSGGSDPNEDPAYLFTLARRHGLVEVVEDWALQMSVSVVEKPLERQPCANGNEETDWVCKKAGKLACSNCKLVLYCSKECQRAHWRCRHKQDCKGFEDFQPGWIQDGRRPNFSPENPPGSKTDKERRPSPGLRLWASIPATDTLNLTKNEGLSAMPRNIALAYVASGGLRNVVRTVNELPPNFTGELTILLNDHEPIIAIRNVLLLLILGRVKDTVRAADIALHFWASAFVHHAAPDVLSHIIEQFDHTIRQDRSFFCDFGNFKVTGTFSEATVTLFRQMSDSKVLFKDANVELERVRFSEDGKDRHHRVYCRLSRSHCLAFAFYRSTPNIVPFGGNVLPTTPNKLLYSPSGRWLQDDMAMPLEEWNIEDVVAAGKAHGTQSEDIFGCLYYYLSDQLRMFAKRLRTFNISFKIFTEEPRDLARKLGEGRYKSHGFEKGAAFDRIDVSDLIDPENVGLAKVLRDWAPFLNKNNPSSTLLGYFSSWVSKQAKSQPGPAEMQLLTLQLIKKGRLDAKKMHADLVPALIKYYTALYDNSSAFEEYLKKQGGDEAAQKAGAERKMKHTIVPHRVGARIDDPPNALPHFPTEASWYLNVSVSQASFTERFVEYGVMV